MPSKRREKFWKTILKLLEKENFLLAFEIYIDRVMPELAKLAASIGDVSHGYCTAILQKCQETAGWLWKQADISEEITEISCEYGIIRLAKTMCGFTGFAEYKDVFAMLQKAVTVYNHLPRQMIEAVHPELTGFLAEIQAGQDRLEIKNALECNASAIQSLFFDRARTEPLQILRSHFHDVTLEDADWLGLLDEMAGGFQMSESAFLAAFTEKIEDFSKRSVVLKVKQEWKRISGEETPAAWAMWNGIPARYLGSTEKVEIGEYMQGNYNIYAKKPCRIRKCAPIRYFNDADHSLVMQYIHAGSTCVDPQNRHFCV